MRLHIHFGIHRTGTTTIHRALYKNKKILEENGILYPDLGFESRHVRLAWQLISNKLSFDDAIEKIKVEVRDDTKMILLSSEDFCLLDIETWLSRLSENFDVSASIYLRRQDVWLESWYNQHIRWPWLKKFSSATPEFFLKKLTEFHWINYHKLLSRITAVIPKERLYINTLESGSVENTTKDLFQFLGIPIANTESKDNSSLTSAKLSIVRRISLFDVTQPGRKRILRALDSLEVREDDGTKYVFNDTQAKSIMKKFSKSNSLVAKEYFNRDKLFLSPYIKNRKPCILSDEKVYQEYIPKLLKAVSQD